MDTSFWDDDEERVQIVYEDDQLQRAQALQEGPASLPEPTEPRRKFDLRERFAATQRKAPMPKIPGPAAGVHKEALRSGQDQELHECATQALEAAALLAADPASPILPAVTTPQVARTGTDDACSTLQPHRHHSIAHVQRLHGSTDQRLQHEQTAHNMPCEEDFPGWQAPVARPASQQAQRQCYSKQTSTLPNAKSSKKAHPLYTSTPSHSKKATQQRKAKAKSKDGFAIRLPATQEGSAVKPFSTSDALRQLTGSSVNRPSTVNENTAPGPRPGSIAELLGDIQVANPDDTIEEVEAQEAQPALLSPSRQDNTRSLLDCIIDGQAQAAERPLAQGQQPHAQTPVLARVSEQSLQSAAHASASTPSMTLQRQFIAGLQDTPTASASQYSSSRTRPGGAAGSLTARLNKVLQLEKAQHAQFETSGSLGRQTMNVVITEQCLEGRVIKCRCHKEQNSADQLFVCFNSKFCRNLSLQSGCCVTLHAPWTEIHLEGCNLPVILCQLVSACS